MPKTEIVHEGIDFRGFNVPTQDPKFKQASEYVESHREQLLELLQEQSQYWEQMLALWDGQEKPLFRDLEIDLGEFLLVCRTYLKKYAKDDPISVVDIASKEWGQSQREFMARTFSPEGVSKEDAKRGAVPVTILAQRLRVDPKQSFEITEFFDPRYVDGSIDGNIRELIRLMNNIGIRTHQSCGGHRICKKQPRIFFPISQLQNVVSLMLAWEREWGTEYRIRLYPETYSRFIELIPPQNTPIAQSHRDLDELTKFLIRETGQSGMTKGLSVGEIYHRIRRKIKSYL